MSCELDLATNVAAQLSISLFPDVQFLTQELNLPGLELIYPNIQGPRIKTQMPAQGINYNKFTIEYLLRVDFSNHASLVNWMQDSLTKTVQESFADGSLFILGPQRTKMAEVKLYGLMPIAVGDVQWNTTDPETTFKKATAVFDYLYYKFV